MNNKITRDGYVCTFGVEVHASLNTKMKAFSHTINDLTSPPNTNVNPIDLGLPGVKPIVNEKMLEYAYRIAKSFDMEISEEVIFDRKNYFYPDLPKGFQITQFFYPIAKNGKLPIILEDNSKKIIHIRDIHLEEDTAKTIVKNDGYYLDFNRSGIPLIEIVSDHRDFANIDEVILFLKQLRYQLMILGVNNGKLHDSSLRVDINISVRPWNQKKLNPKVEIKNLNSFSNIRKALEYEINHQIECIKNNKKIESVTKRFNEKEQKTEFMRFKNTDNEYNYFHEGNINSIKLTDEVVKYFERFKIIKISDAIKKLSKYDFSEAEMEIFLESKEFYNFFFDLIDIFSLNNIKSYFNKIFIPEFKENKIDTLNYIIPKKIIIWIIKLLSSNKITNKQASQLTSDLLKNIDIVDELEKYENQKLLDEDNIAKLINNILKNNPEILQDISTRPQRVSKFIMGQLMKETKGKINPKTANDLISNIIKLSDKSK